MAAARGEGLVAGVDIGGTRTKLAVLDGAGLIVETELLPRPRDRHGDLIADLIERLSGRGFRAVGLSLPGLVDPAFGSRDLPGKLPGLSGRPLVSELGDVLRIPVTCLNDGQAAAIGEWRKGSGRGFDDLVVVTLGTGVGSGVILSGRPLVGGWPGTGNGVGHLSLDGDGDRCLCGNVGCPETRVSAPAMVAAATAHIARGVSSSMARHGRALSFEHIAADAHDHDGLATQLLDRFVRDLGVMLVSAVHAYQPSALVLSGGVATAASGHLGDVQRYVDEQSWRYPRDRPIPVLLAQLGDFSGAVGAAVVANDPSMTGGGGRADPSP